jgi:hypothetical protein
LPNHFSECLTNNNLERVTKIVIATALAFKNVKREYDENGTNQNSSLKSIFFIIFLFYQSPQLVQTKTICVSKRKN